MVNEAPRIPRKPGQPAGSDKHSDLYTDENPKGTIQGLKFATVADAKASVSKIKNSGRKHAHKIQAAIAMEQRAKVAGKASAAAVYRSYINAMKEKTKKMNEAKIGGVKMKKLGSNPGSYKRLVQRHLGKSPDKKITKSDGDKIIAIAKKKGNKDLARKGSFIKNVIAEKERGKMKPVPKAQYEDRDELKTISKELGKASKMHKGQSDRIKKILKKSDIDENTYKSFKEFIFEKSVPTNPELWSRAKSLARSKFDVYPSAYANGWAAKWYKSKGGGWKKG